ncbi:MAG TPA: hypothetical protein PLE35_04685, partial [Lentisphaeria bacterium]|nr:hypothetical protein [Lentisphaeria bacterium]
LTFYFRHCVRTGQLVPLGRTEWRKEVRMAEATSHNAPNDSNENQAGNDRLGTSNTHQETKR